ncbi:sugar phosphate nucleotidyltransferase [Aerococcus urinaeequi]|uniref:sugar phosphate nucleotidyltransferase n=1 Tax=Aerococcus urinaeequi TaxID=51665 RepID=UPI0039BC2D2D
MKLIMLSGGSGTRLWPLSNDIRSKQFLKLLKDPNGQAESMVQRVYRQVRESGIDSDIVIATSQKQVDSVKSHLGDSVDIVVEPERRDTFPAIALATAYLYYEGNSELDETVSIMPVDPYTSLDYFKQLNALNKKMQENDEYNLGLLGIHPTYPSSKYGYILNDNGAVSGFMEKPEEDVAAQLIEKGAVWNAGVFVFKISYMLEKLSEFIDYFSYEDVLSQYHKLPKNSFDYEVSEKENRITMLSYDGAWKDLGTWKTLTEEMETSTLGSVVLSDSVEDTHVINELDIPVIAIGTNDLLIAASPDGILVSDKVESAQLKKYVEKVDSYPKFEETSWGSKKVIDFNKNEDGSHSLTTSIYVEAGKVHRYKTENNTYNITIIDGQVEFVNTDTQETDKLFVGDAVKMVHEGHYELRALTRVKYIENSYKPV